MDICKKLKWCLEAATVSVLMTRDSDVKVGLTDRCIFANTRGADLFVSVHLNADRDDDGPGTTEARGHEIWIWPGDLDSRALADAIAAQMKIVFPDEPFRGVKEGDLAVVRETNMTAVLIETGFIDHSETPRQLSDEAVQWEMARAIAIGVKNYIAAG